MITNLNYLIPKSLQPKVVNLSFFYVRSNSFKIEISGCKNIGIRKIDFVIIAHLL